MSTALKRPLDPTAVRAADEALWRAHPELKGRRLTMNPDDAAYRKEWVAAYHAALKQVPPPVVSSLGVSPATPVEPCPLLPAGLSAADIERRLDEASWIGRDDEARSIVAALTPEQLRALPADTRQRLKDELNSGYVSTDDKDALKKIWQAEHEPAIKQALEDQRAMLESRKAELERWNDTDKAAVKTWFGADDEATRQTLLDRTEKELALNKTMTIDNFAPADPPKSDIFAYVYPNDKTHTIYLDGAFDKAPATGKDSKAGTLAHEMSHFSDIGGTNDHVYGAAGGKKLAQTAADQAIENADNFEYYMEKVP